MPRKIDYPRASFRSALEFAQAVQSLGGKATPDVCAEKLGKKVGSGGFNTIVSAAVKFGLVKQAQGVLAINPIVKSIQLSYDDDEKNRHYQEAFLTPLVFRSLVERFSGSKLPIEVLPKMLAKEFDVDVNASSAIAKHFIDGARFSGILTSNNDIISFDSIENEDRDIVEVTVDEVTSKASYYEHERGLRALNSIQDVQKDSYELIASDNEKRKIQIPLPNKRMAELTVPTELTTKDLEIIKMQLEVLRVYIENS